MSKISQVTSGNSPSTLAPTSVQNEVSQEKPLSPGGTATGTITSKQPTQEGLISQTETGRQATQANPDTAKLVATQGAKETQATASTGPVTAEDPVDQVAKKPATPFEEIPASKLTHDEAKTELLALQDKGDITVEFTDEGKTRLFVPMFNVNFKKETEDKEKSQVKSFLFPKPQDAVSISRLSEWASLKGIKEILFRGFAKPKEDTKATDKPAESPPTVENPSTPAPASQAQSAKPTPAPKPQTPAPVQTQPQVQQPAEAPKPTIAPQAQAKQPPEVAAPKAQTTTSPAPVSTQSQPVQSGVPRPSSPPPISVPRPSSPPPISVPRPSSPPPVVAQKQEPPTIPLSRLQTGGTIPLSSSATPIQKPDAAQQKPLTASAGGAQPTFSPMKLALSQSMAQKTQTSPLESRATSQSQEQTPTGTQNPATPNPLQSLTTAQDAPRLVASENLRSDKTQNPPTPAPSKPSTALSSLGDRLQSLIHKPSTSLSATKYSSLSPRTSSLIERRPSTGLWTMDIAGYKGQDPKTGKPIEAHGNRDMIRFNHHSYLQSVRSYRAEEAREVTQREAQEKELQAQAQRAEEQQQLRMLLELEQMRQLDSNLIGQHIPPVQTGPETAAAPAKEVKPAPLDPAAALLQHQWQGDLKKN